MPGLQSCQSSSDHGHQTDPKYTEMSDRQAERARGHAMRRVLEALLG
jgi:hypothetical protein